MYAAKKCNTILPFQAAGCVFPAHLSLAHNTAAGRHSRAGPLPFVWRQVPSWHSGRRYGNRPRPYCCSFSSPEARLQRPESNRAEKNTDRTTQSEHIPTQYPKAPSWGMPGIRSVVRRNARPTRVTNMLVTATHMTYFTSLVASKSREW